MKQTVQTRAANGEILHFDTLKDAFTHARTDHTVWKISFSFGDERVRLIRENGWIYESITGNRETTNEINC